MIDKQKWYLISEEQVAAIEHADLYTTKIIGRLTDLAKAIRSHPAPDALDDF